MRRSPRTASVIGSSLAKLHELEGSSLGDRVHVGAGVDHCALACEDALGARRSNQRTGDSVGAIYGDRLIVGIDRRNDVDRGAERAVAGARIVGATGTKVDV